MDAQYYNYDVNDTFSAGPEVDLAFDDLLFGTPEPLYVPDHYGSLSPTLAPINPGSRAPIPIGLPQSVPTLTNAAYSGNQWANVDTFLDVPHTWTQGVDPAPTYNGAFYQQGFNGPMVANSRRFPSHWLPNFQQTSSQASFPTISEQSFEGTGSFEELFTPSTSITTSLPASVTQPNLSSVQAHSSFGSARSSSNQARSIAQSNIPFCQASSSLGSDTASTLPSRTISLARTPSSRSTTPRSPLPRRSIPLHPSSSRGRKGPLTAQSRQEAADMRRLKACATCRIRKAKCDRHTPCKACIHYLGSGLVSQPCRGRMLDSLTSMLLRSGSSSGGGGGGGGGGNVFPAARTVDEFLGETEYALWQGVYKVQLSFGFGPPMPRRVRLVKSDGKKLFHKHTVYAWPPPARQTTPKRQCEHYVFPAVLAETEDLDEALEQHLALLVEGHFEAFPLFGSPLKVLGEIWRFYKSLRSEDDAGIGCDGEEAGQLLLQALKLLVLVHVGDDLSLDPNDDIVRTWFPFFDTPDHPVPSTCTPREPTPCFIRGQFGAVMPALAERLMKDCLCRLEAMSLSRQCRVWPVIFATFAVLLMTVETIQYHGAKEGYHAIYDDHDGGYRAEYDCQTASAPVPIMRPGRSVSEDVMGGTGDEEVDALLSFYKTCYSGCHSKLQDSEEPR
ncbi:hypothetical protein LTS18_008440, partial [Coniosporium uncinatum]